MPLQTRHGSFIDVRMIVIIEHALELNSCTLAVNAHRVDKPSDRIGKSADRSRVETALHVLDCMTHTSSTARVHGTLSWKSPFDMSEGGQGAQEENTA